MKISFVLVLSLLIVLPVAFSDLRVGFYSKKCPRAESIIRQVVQKRFAEDGGSITAALLRMHFHDCFVRGCDASILVDPTKTKSSEKKAGANLTVRGYDLIDKIKKALEAACPGTVSCADIVTLATRDSVVFAGGPNYTVPTGRRDGFVSNPSDVNLPGPSSSVSQALQAFTEKGMTLNEMVTLLGAHTVGFARCSFFEDRLSSFRGTPNPTMAPALDTKLVKLCGSSSKPVKSDPNTVLDQSTPLIFDNQFYKEILFKRGVLEIDQNLALDPSSRGVVASFASNGAEFKKSFAAAMVKLGSIEVLVNNDGEIRRNCRRFNSAG